MSSDANQDDPISASQHQDSVDPITSQRSATIRNQRLRRRVELGLVAVLIPIFAYAVWHSDIWQHQEISSDVAIVADAQFAALCDQVANEKWDELEVTQFAVDDVMIRQVANLSSLEVLKIDRGRVTDEGISSITALPKLQHLRLRESPISDEGLKTLAQCETLWYLNLPQADCTADGVAALAQLPRLRQLRLGSPRLGNEVAESLVTIETLRGLHLIGIPLTDEGLQKVTQLPHLESLYLDDSAVTEAGWQWLFENHPELHVHVDQEHHDRDPHGHSHHGS